METNFAFLCDAASQGSDGKFNALGIGVSQIRATQVPAQHARLVMVAEVGYTLAEAGTKTLLLRVIDDDGADLMPPVTGEIAFNEHQDAETLSPVAHLVLEMNALTFPRFGRYSVDLQLDGVSIASMPLELRPAPAVV
ncbi:MAG: hypothetical protein DWI59_02700 [Chloroflexi bacterium]|nr:MAG: hypothetical protein DWI59_02700 [Chloroflexota bacterium]